MAGRLPGGGVLQACPAPPPACRATTPARSAPRPLLLRRQPQDFLYTALPALPGLALAQRPPPPQTRPPARQTRLSAAPARPPARPQRLPRRPARARHLAARHRRRPRPPPRRDPEEREGGSSAGRRPAGGGGPAISRSAAPPAPGAGRGRTRGAPLPKWPRRGAQLLPTLRGLGTAGVTTHPPPRPSAGGNAPSRLAARRTQRRQEPAEAGRPQLPGRGERRLGCLGWGEGLGRRGAPSLATHRPLLAPASQTGADGAAGALAWQPPPRPLGAAPSRCGGKSGPGGSGSSAEQGRARAPQQRRLALGEESRAEQPLPSLRPRLRAAREGAARPRERERPPGPRASAPPGERGSRACPGPASGKARGGWAEGGGVSGPLALLRQASAERLPGPSGPGARGACGGGQGSGAGRGSGQAAAGGRLTLGAGGGAEGPSLPQLPGGVLASGARRPAGGAAVQSGEAGRPAGGREGGPGVTRLGRPAGPVMLRGRQSAPPGRP